MAMTLSGSDGSTKSEMLSALQMPTQFGVSGAHQTIGSALVNYFKSTEGVTVNLANGMFANNSESVKEQFKNELKSYYNAQAENVWLPSGFVLFPLLGKWAEKFPKENTNDAEFHKLDGPMMKVKMMFLREKMPIADLQGMDSTMVRIPFLKSNWEMVIVLPRTRDGLKQLMKKMCEPNTISTILSTKCYEEKVELFLPRFKLGEGNAIDMSKHLTEMGMKDLFMPGRANLGGISDSKNLYVSAVHHKAILEVDEEGATAAAATASTIMCMCAPCCPEVRVDHPFFVSLVCDKTVPVFIGHVVEPESL